MNHDEFNGAAGEFIFIQNTHNNYHAFIPRLLPVQIRLDDETATLLAKASFELGRLESIIREFPEFAELQAKKEALESARIDGNRETLDNVFRYEKGKRSVSDNKAAKEAIRHLDALSSCISSTGNREIGISTVLEAHKILANSHKANPGVFRKGQGWLGTPGMQPSAARYVPPPQEKILPLLENALYFMRENESLHPLIQIALFHYQFEAIRPFDSANGRTGRMLISLYLQKSGMLTNPCVCISEYFERNRAAYYDSLLHVSKSGDYAHWVKFFLKSMLYQSRKALRTAEKLRGYKNSSMKKLGNSKASESSRAVLNELFRNPFITIADARNAIQATYPTAKRAVDRLVAEGILVQEKKERNRGFFADKIFEIINEE